MAGQRLQFALRHTYYIASDQRSSTQAIKYFLYEILYRAGMERRGT